MGRVAAITPLPYQARSEDVPRKTAEDDEFTARVAHNVKEACDLIEVGFEYVTGGYNDGGKIFRKRN